MEGGTQGTLELDTQTPQTIPMSDESHDEYTTPPESMSSEEVPIALRRTRREIRPPNRYSSN